MPPATTHGRRRRICRCLQCPRRLINKTLPTTILPSAMKVWPPSSPPDSLANNAIKMSPSYTRLSPALSRTRTSMLNPSAPSSRPTTPSLRNMDSVQTMTKSTSASCYALEDAGGLAKPCTTALKPCSPSWEFRSKSMSNKTRSKTSRGALRRPQGTLPSCKHGPKPAAIPVSIRDVLRSTHQPIQGVRPVQSRIYDHRPAHPSQTIEKFRSRKQMFGHLPGPRSGRPRDLNADEPLDRLQVQPEPQAKRQEAG